MTRVPINIPLVASIIAISLASLVMAVQLSDLAGAVLTPRPREDPIRARIDDLLVEHADGMNTYRGRFDGRSLFFKPKPPPPKPRKPEIVDRTPAPLPPPPGPKLPARQYGGPSVSFVIGNEVWFHNGSHASVGEEVSGVTIIASDPPWSVTLGYGGGEYPIELFKKTKLFPDQPTKTSNGPFPGLKSPTES